MPGELLQPPTACFNIFACIFKQQLRWAGTFLCSVYMETDILAKSALFKNLDKEL